MSTETFNRLEVEAALCVWEFINDVTLLPHVSTMSRPEWIEYRDGLGSGEMRYQSMPVGQWCLKIYDFLKASMEDVWDMMSYDWEIIPMFMDFAENEGTPTIYENELPDPYAVAQAVARRVMKQQFIWDCERASEKIWCYRDFVADHPEKFEKAFEDGEDPATFVKALGEEYDLIKF